MENGSVTVTGNGQKKRLVYFDLPQLRAALDDYLKVRSILTEEEKPLFANLKDGKRLSVRGAQYISLMLLQQDLVRKLHLIPYAILLHFIY